MKLTELPLFFLDLQTTGAKPDNAHILEMAFGDLKTTQSFLVEQPPEHSVPKRIQIITGVSDKDLVGATPFKAAIQQLLEFIHDKPMAVIHFSQFEKPFLQAAFDILNIEIPFTIIDTHEIAKRLFPNLPTRGIKGLAGYFNYDAGELKRSASHVDATKIIWTNLLKTLAEKNVTTLEELQLWLADTPKEKRTKYEYPLAKEKRLTLPDKPGIYRMLNHEGVVLYVGKATSLKSRVNSYFRGQKNRDSRKLEMLTMTVDLRVTVCETPLESALMETDEIKRLNPRYNIALKKDHRNIAFFDRDFSSVTKNADEIHTIGPFSNAMVFESMMTLVTYLNSTYKEGGLPPETLFFEELDPQLILDGFKLFCERHGLAPEQLTSMRSIIAKGIWWHKAEEDIEELTEEEEAEAEEVLEEIEEEEVELTAEDIADKFERHFKRVGRSYLRAQKLNKLLNADIEYTLDDEEQSYKLQVRNGYIKREDTDIDMQVNNWEHHSVETYDRMTVLLSELDRVKTNGGDYTIHFTT